MDSYDIYIIIFRKCNNVLYFHGASDDEEIEDAERDYEVDIFVELTLVFGYKRHQSILYFSYVLLKLEYVGFITFELVLWIDFVTCLLGYENL